MGLDITAWRRLRPVAEPDYDSEYHDTHVDVHASSHFPGRTAGLANGWYEGSRCELLGPFGGFRAGSYSGYNSWREWLAKLAGYPATESPEAPDKPHSAGAWAASGGPFWELINFYDNEGEIGPIVSAKLAADFAEWDERAKAASPEGWEYDRYKFWRLAFEWASDGGCVEFA